jgi:predicted DCC family thiol-disulfide oxidoreductase YuxK
MCSGSQMSEIIVFFDGQCELCKNSITWVSKKLAITALDFHTTELAKFNLSKEQCSKEVFVLHEQLRFSGARAVAFLLNARGNKVLAFIITALGPLSRSSYKWVASHRNTWPVRALSYLIRINS